MDNEEAETRKAKGVDDWHEDFKFAIAQLSTEQHKLVYSYWPDIIRGIDLGLGRDKNNPKIRDLEVRCWCLEYEELLYYIPIIIRAQPPHGYVINGVRRICSSRKKSWFYRIREAGSGNSKRPTYGTEEEEN